MEQTIAKLQEDEASVAGETRTREKEMEQGLQEAQKVGTTVIELESAVG